jgi:hypothetical protein
MGIRKSIGKNKKLKRTATAATMSREAELRRTTKSPEARRQKGPK